MSSVGNIPGVDSNIPKARTVANTTGPNPKTSTCLNYLALGTLNLDRLWNQESRYNTMVNNPILSYSF